MLAFASIFQVPMVGADVCGFMGNTEEKLCARWASLGAFSPFYRNHNMIESIPQEYYQWDSVADTARKAIEIRYKLLDYIYTAFYDQTVTGHPVLNPLFYLYPKDENTYPLDLQFFYGDAILVSPVTEENSTSVSIYLPDDIFYDYYTRKPVRGHAKTITLNDVPFTHIPLHIRGGTIIPARVESANTTKALREKPFEIIIAPDLNGNASGRLYIDDGQSLEQPHTIDVEFTYHNGSFKMAGRFDLDVPENVKIASISVLGREKNNHGASTTAARKNVKLEHNAESQVLTAKVELPLTRNSELDLS